MNSTINKNPYEYLKLDADCTIEAVPAQSTWTITDDKSETVLILASVLPSGKWCYGYTVYWADGRLSHANPDPGLGLFESQRESQLYALGFLSIYSSYFLESTNKAIRKAISDKSQATLF